MAEVQDKTINALDEATIINNSDITPIVQAVGSNYVTKKAELGDIGDHIATDMTFSELQTTSKNLVGAINEASQNGGASEITELEDVNINSSTLANGDALVYDSASSKWVNGEVTPGASDLSDLGDVAISSPSNDQVLKYNSTSGKWENGTGGGGGASSLDDLSDVAISSPTANQVLKYDDVSGKWENAAESTGVSDLDDLTDVSISSPVDGQVLTYDSNSSTWINSSGTGGGGGHTIVDSAGTDLAQRSNLQFIGAYSEDNSTDDTTEVNVIRSMTKAEFDLLSDDEKVGIINITDITTTEGFYPVIYSEDERTIGVWTDGKPLYEKTFSFTPTSSTYTVSLAALGIDKAISVGGVVIQTSGNIVPLGYFTAGTDYAFSYYDKTNTNLKVAYAGNYNSAPWLVVVRYTKTADTPGSGQWTPQGVPAVHYSTDEQVVGTWVDGRPIYEKTIAISESNFIVGWKWFTANLTCDHLIDSEVWLKDDNPTYCYTAMPVAVDFSNGNIGVCNNMGGTMGNVTGYVTVRYTKATS